MLRRRRGATDGASRPSECRVDIVGNVIAAGVHFFNEKVVTDTELHLVQAPGDHGRCGNFTRRRPRSPRGEGTFNSIPIVLIL